MYREFGYFWHTVISYRICEYIAPDAKSKESQGHDAVRLIVSLGCCVYRSPVSGAIKRWPGSGWVAWWTTQCDVCGPRSAAADCSVVVPRRSAGYRQLSVHCRHFTLKCHCNQPSSGQSATHKSPCNTCCVNGFSVSGYCTAELTVSQMS